MARASELQLIRGLRGALAADSTPRPWLVQGVGDDAARITAPSLGSELCLSVDCAVEGIHFRMDECGGRAAAAKAVKAALSDIAAMGGGDQGWVLAAVTFDTRRPAEERPEILAAIVETCRQYQFALIGGDITAGEVATSFAITVGAWSSSPVSRSGARPGDVLCVSGELGGSIQGRHLSFEPRLGLAQALKATVAPTAMIDVSDGLGPDLLRICTESEVCGVVDVDSVPLSAEAGGECERALEDGEDYELLFTVSPERDASLPDELEGIRLTRIGVVEEGLPGVDLVQDGTRQRMKDGRGWDPLRQEEL